VGGSDHRFKFPRASKRKNRNTPLGCLVCVLCYLDRIDVQGIPRRDVQVAAGGCSCSMVGIKMIGVTSPLHSKLLSGGWARSMSVIACLRQLVWMFPSDALLSSPRPQYGIPTRSRSLPEAYRWRFGEVSLRTFLPVINQSQTTRLSSLACKALEAVFPCGLPGAGTAVEALAQSEGQELVRYSRTAFWSFDKALRVRVHLH